jgi:uroporphyrinogen decarboxylase
MEGLIDRIGVDAKHSFEDNIQAVEDFSQQYGHRVGVIGGVDMDLLVRGSENDVRKRTRQILEACTPTGGYLLGTGNSLASFIPPRNYFAMLSEGRRFAASAG